MANDKDKDSTGEEAAAVKVGRARNTGDLAALKRMDWIAVRTAYRRVKGADTFDQQGKALYEYFRASDTYAKRLEQIDLADELKQVRQELAELRQSEGLRKVV